MIEFLTGKIVSKKPEYLIINVNGIGYKLNISINSYDQTRLNENIKILTYFSVSENNQELYGFVNNEERELFLLLISVSGIGPKTAINMLSAVSANDFKNRLIAGEVKMLTSLPGIGPKTARRIIVELKDKFVDVSKDELPIETNSQNSDAFYALKSLGFHPKLINEAINKVISLNKKVSTEELIKQSLKILK